MASANKIRVNLGKPLPDPNAHECLYVHQGTEEKALKVSFRRTIRVPEDDTTYDLPPNLGYFPLYNVSHYKETLPESMMLKGGCFMPVHDREAMWISFKSTKPFAIKIFVGGINAISGEPIIETLATALRRSRLIHEKSSIQDYAIIDPADKGQLWLDGIAKLNGKVMQFVAVPAGSGYSIEAQIAGSEAVGGIQIVVTPIKTGPVVTVKVKRLGQATLAVRTHLNATVYDLMNNIAARVGSPVEQLSILFNNRRLEQNRLLSHYAIQANSTVNLVLNLVGGGLLQCFSHRNAEMAIGAGGLIKQSILRDPHASTVWDSENSAMFNIQLLNATNFQRITGILPPPSPITAASYAAAGLPFFSLPAEIDSGIQGLFSDIKNSRQLDVENSRAWKGEGLGRELRFPTIQLDRTGSREQSQFRSVEMMEEMLKKLGVVILD